MKILSKRQQYDILVYIIDTSFTYIKKQQYFQSELLIQNRIISQELTMQFKIW